MKKRTKDKDLFSEEYVKEHRRFPVGYTLLLVLLLVAQLGLIFVAVLYRPQPKDVIEQYSVSVMPLKDGSLDIRYHIHWRVLADDEPLTWVAIGLPNRNFTYYKDLLSDNIEKLEKYDDDYGVYADITFKEAYHAGDLVTFTFMINQQDMLCRDKSGNYFYEFIPCWFNSIDVEKYTFSWYVGDYTAYSNTGAAVDGWLRWQGEMPRGSFVPMEVKYGSTLFSGADTVKHVPFSDEDVYDELASDRRAAVVACVLVIILLAAIEVLIIDSYVSYGRGRGFLVGHGHYMHTYGHRNPAYVRARNAHRSRGGGFSGGGCACACACACAGGGRAGCSQKDTYHKRTEA